MMRLRAHLRQFQGRANRLPAITERSMSTPAFAVDEKMLLFYGRKKQTQVTLQNLMETATGVRLNNFSNYSRSVVSDAAKVNIQIACFLHRELPVRLAHRAVELEATELFKSSPSIQTICNGYKHSFAEIINCPAPFDVEKEAVFAKIVEDMYERHSSTMITMARGAHEIRQVLKKNMAAFADFGEIQRRLDDFYLSRIGIRLLIGQYLAVRKNPIDDKMIGLVSPCCSPKEIAEHAAHDAAFMCSRTYGDAPEVTFHGKTDLHFPYVPSHLSYVLLELLKNSMRATVETHGADNKMPPIRIVISGSDGEDQEDVVIKVSDEGGGIKRSNMSRIWSYLFTTANPAIVAGVLSSAAEDRLVRDFDTSSPLAGLGYGLPISRNYCRFFGGDLTIMSMEGYGTDSFMYLPRLGNKASVV